MPRAVGRVLVLLLLLSAGTASTLLIGWPNFGLAGVIGNVVTWGLLLAIVAFAK